MADVPAVAAPQEFYLWPENLPTWRLFVACATQWRTGTGGREGFDYTGVRVVIEELRIRPRQRRQRFRELQVMEAAALQAWAAAQNE